MLERHHPRLCRSCAAPMARQETGCWHCGTEWAAEDRPKTTLYAVPDFPGDVPVIPDMDSFSDGDGALEPLRVALAVALPPPGRPR